MHLNTCDEVLNAGADQVVCHPGGSVFIDAAFTGDPTNILDIQWTPTTGLSNPKILNPVANVNQTITYNLTLSHYSEDNHFFNGDFEQGNSGFTSDYIHSPNNLIPEGVYAITSNPNIQHPGFSPCPDHTSGTGNMMAVNGSGIPNQNVWCQTVNVTPNTNYVFIAWATSLVSSSPAILQFSVNNVLLGNSFQISPTTCQWQQFFTIWNFGAATTATFCVVNQNTATGGNDFALDDIFLGEVCIYTDEITITVLDEIREEQEHILCPGEVVEIGGELFDYPGVYEISLISSNGCDSIIIAEIESVVVEAIIEDPEYLSCEVTQIDLDGSLSFGTNGIDYYLWTTNDGSIISDSEQPIVTINSEGLYQLVVRTTYNGVTCYDTSEIEIFQDTFSPQFLILEPERLSCSDSTLFLEAVNVDIPPGSTYMWSTEGGRILNGGQSLSPQVQGTGIYILQVTNPQNGCSNIQQVELLGDTSLPVILLIESPAINCISKEVIIVIDLPGDDGTYEINWQTTDGNIASGEQSLNPIVSEAGTYIVYVTDPQTGCRSSLAVEIIEDNQLPELILRDRDTLGCMMDEIEIRLLLNPDTFNLEIIWETPNGILLSGDSTQTPLVGAPGHYQVIILNTQNGCRDSASIEIIRFEEYPDANAGGTLTIDCRDSVLIPDITGSSLGPEYSLTWFRNGVNFSQQIKPEISISGTYVLEIRNNTNRCISYDTIEVYDIRRNPEIVIAAPLTINCDQVAIEINANNSVPMDGTFSWTGPANSIISGTSSANPIVNAGGWYLLTLTDTMNYCVTTDSVLVLEDLQIPVIIIDNPDSLDCLTNQIALDASTSMPAERIEYQWSGPQGAILNGANTPQPIISQSGWYILQVRDSINGCSSVDSVQVIRNLDLPEFEVSTPDSLTCIVNSVTLQAEYDVQWNNITSGWSTIDGNIVSGANTLRPIVNRAGTYTFTIRNTANGCIDSISVLVEENKIQPNAYAGTNGIIPCDPMEYILDGTNSSGLGILDFQWFTNDGMFAGSANQPAVVVVRQGQYILEVTDRSNGCSAKDTVILAVILPERIDFSLTDPRCGEESGLLSISGGSGGLPPYSYIINGNVYPEGSIIPLLPGTWVVRMQDDRGCQIDTLVMVEIADTLNVLHQQLFTIVQGEKAEVVLNFNLPLSEIALVRWIPEDGVIGSNNLSIWNLAPLITTNYQLTVISIDGCETISNLRVNVLQPPSIFVPNVFSPRDRNGINDRFFPISRPGSVKRVINMEVFDRWGSKVFNVADFPPDEPEYGWNGTHKGYFVNPAVFIWALEAELASGEIVHLFGEVTVL